MKKTIFTQCFRSNGVPIEMINIGGFYTMYLILN
jgi:hypothetical protein